MKIKRIKRKPRVAIRSLWHRKIQNRFGYHRHLVKGLESRVLCVNADYTTFLGPYYQTRQKYGPYDTDDCWVFSPSKVVIEAQLNALWPMFSPQAQNFFLSTGIATDKTHGWFNISEQFYGIVSGNLDNGGTAEELFQLIQDYGLVGANMLEYTDAQAYACPTEQAFINDYFDKRKITQAMLDVGKQSKQWFTLTYDRVGKMWVTPDKTTLTAAMVIAPLAYGVPVFAPTWNQINVPKYVSGTLAHEVGGYKMSQTMVGYPILDNYDPYQKTLADGYSINVVSQAIIMPNSTATPIQQPKGIWEQVWQSVYDYLARIGIITPIGSVSYS